MRKLLATLLLWTFCISSLMACVSCAPKTTETVVQTKYVFMIPEKVVTPEKPAFREYDTTKYLYQAPNFTRLQQNTVLLKNYANALKDTVTYYETAIDTMVAKKQQLEGTAAGTESSVAKD